MATQTVEQITRLPEFQEKFMADLLKSARGIFQPTDEGGLGLTMPYSPRFVADLSTGQQLGIGTAMGGVGAYEPYLQAAGSLMAPDAYRKFMDPYLEDVVQRAQADIGREGAKQYNVTGANAARSGAFGGSRQAVAEAEIGRNIMEQQARTGERLRSAGFAQASQLAGQRAQGLANLGRMGQAMNVQDVNTLLGIGSLQQQNRQEQLNAAQQNLLAQQQLPFQQVGFLSDIFRGVPALQQTTNVTNTPPPSAMSQGIGLLGAGLYGGLFNPLFGG